MVKKVNAIQTIDTSDLVKKADYNTKIEEIDKKISNHVKNITNTERNERKYELDTSPRDLSTNFTLGDCLFGVFKLTKNADPDKYRYNGYGIGFDARSQFLLSNSEWGKNDVIFGVDNSSSVHGDNRKKDILVFCEGPTDWFDDAAITAEAK